MSMAIFNSYVTKYQRVFINIIFKTFYLGLVYVSMKMAKMRDVAHVLSMFVFALGEHRFSVLVMFVIIYIYIYNMGATHFKEMMIPLFVMMRKNFVVTKLGWAVVSVTCFSPYAKISTKNKRENLSILN